MKTFAQVAAFVVVSVLSYSMITVGNPPLFALFVGTITIGLMSVFLNSQQGEVYLQKAAVSMKPSDTQ